ncbi:membrane-bound PQQ-dependent dehydrogenase, glucose/quinate/shikimate family [Shinella daejeonensis]|nr:membrane-bound PQQ-dependent dehydrogenase, glucose/quinate/shikimate family [Shinella daejeonensis]
MVDRSDSPSPIVRFWLALLALIILAAGLFFVIGGGVLIYRGGSWYFLLAGLLLMASAIQIGRARMSGAWLFGLAFLGTVLWSFWEVGLDYWGLVSRLMAMTVGAAAVAFTVPLLARKRSETVAALVAGAVLAVVAIAGFASMFRIHPEVSAASAVAQRIAVDPQSEQKNWDHYGNDAEHTRFAALDQINIDNVGELEVAWTFRTGDIPQSTGSGAEDQLTPMQIGDRLFICTPKNNVIALDVDTGEQIWRRDFNANVGGIWERCRGMAYFDVNAPLKQPTTPGSTPVTPVALASGDTCERRIFMNTIDARLVALKADNGELCTGFGREGVIDLTENMGDLGNIAYYTMTSAPTVAGTTVVVGGRVADNVKVDMPGGVVRGFDVVTGQMRWHFDPGSDDPNAPLDPGQTYRRSTPNVWAGMSYDPAMNTVFMPVGSPSVDLWGASRTSLDLTYGASVLAVDATTGARRWVYQTVHNDLWDFDVPMAPTLIDFPKADGTRVPALVVGTKAGQIFVLDRLTGEPLTAVEERPVRPGTIPNEPYSPTQPFSVGMPQIGAQTLSEADMWGATPFDQLVCRIWFKGMRYDGLFTVPDVDVSLSFPGSLGGMNWGGISADPNNDLIFVNDMRLGLWVQMVSQQAGGALSSGGEAPNAGMGEVPLGGTPFSVLKDRFMSPLGVPCQKPPFGTMTAIDLKTQKIAWQVPVGTVEDTGPLGLKMMLPIPAGLPTLGPSLATQGGLLFFAGTQDYYLRAWDTATGREVWKARMPVGSQGGPITYKSPNTGKQYVVISAGGARQSPDRGDYIIAYTLP